jgi:hypothetical protein
LAFGVIETTNDLRSVLDAYLIYDNDQTNMLKCLCISNVSLKHIVALVYDTVTFCMYLAESLDTGDDD